MTHRLALFGLLLATATGANAAADVATGKHLVETHCIKCHAARFGGDGSAIYTRPDHRVTTYEGLRKQITRCRDMLGINWFDEEVNDVAAYLNQAYYHFKAK